MKQNFLINKILKSLLLVIILAVQQMISILPFLTTVLAEEAEPNIQSLLRVGIEKEPLLGDIMKVSVSLQNVGTDRAYKASIELELPSVISFKDAFVSSEMGELTPLYPNIVGRTLTWYNMADLLSGETFELQFTLNIAGEPTFYVNDLLTLEIEGSLYADALDAEPVAVANETVSTYIQGLSVETSVQNEILTGTEETYQQERTIELQNNPETDAQKYDPEVCMLITEVPAVDEAESVNDVRAWCIENGYELRSMVDEEDASTQESGASSQVPEAEEETAEELNEYLQPVIITETLDNGIEYVPGSETVTTKDQETGELLYVEHEFSILDTEEGKILLQWILNNLTTDAFKNPIFIKYLLSIPYQERSETDAGTDGATDNTGGVIEEDTTYDIETNVEAYYETRNESNVLISLNDTDSVTAKYLTINKQADKNTIVPGDEVTYTVAINTSQYYTFESLTITDIIPNGMTFVSSDYIPEHVLTNVDGTTTVEWNISELQPEDSFQFEYTVQLNETYSDDTLVLARDYFTNEVTIQTEWIDTIDESRTGEATEIDTKTVQTPKPVVTTKVWNPMTGTWVDMVQTNLDYEVQFKTTVHFPEGVPTEDVIIKNFIPPYTAVSSQQSAFSFSSSGSFEKDVEVVFNCAIGEPIGNDASLAVEGICIDLGAVSEGAVWEGIFTVRVINDSEKPIKNDDILRNLTRVYYTNHVESTFIDYEQAALQVRDPRAAIKLNEGAKYTKSDLVQKWTKITVPDMSVENEVRFIYCENEAECEEAADLLPQQSPNISSWQSRDHLEQTDLDYVINGNETGEKTICIQAKDEKENVSPWSCDTIILDDVAPIGTVKILDDNGTDVSRTEDNTLTLEVTFEDLVLDDGLDGSGVKEVFVSNDGITWTSYNSNLLQELQIANYEIPVERGIASIFVRFLDYAGNESKIYSDKVLIAPDPRVNDIATYGIKYYPATSYEQLVANCQPPDANCNIYTFGNIPTELQSEQQIQLYLNVKNTGLMTWYAAGGDQTQEGFNPVNISYHWINAVTSETYQWEGNRGQLAKTVFYDQTHEDVSLLINTPSIPGNYLFQIDAIHEGVTWFSAQANEMPEFNVHITSPLEGGGELPDYNNEDDFGHGADDEQTEPPATQPEVKGVSTQCRVGTIATLYSAPEESFEIVPELPEGLSIDVRYQFTDAEGNVWLQAALSDGRLGWIQKDVVSSCDTTTIPNWPGSNLDYYEGHVCNARTIEIRFYHSWASHLLTTLPVTTRLYVLQSFPEPKGGNWIQVVTEDGLTGWIFDNFICEGFDDDGTYNIHDEVPFQRPYENPGTDPEGNKYEVPITSDFGERNGTFHTGVDYGLYCGLEVLAAADGEVVEVATNGVVAGNTSTPSTPANYVKIRHFFSLEGDQGGGSLPKYESWYWHLGEIYVEKGTQVTKGMPIGTSGNTGYVRGNPDVPVEDQGCHLHFEVRKVNDDGSMYAVDPELLIDYTEQVRPPILTEREALETYLGYGSVEKSKLKPVYRFFNTKVGVHLFTIDTGEKAEVQQIPEWQYEGIPFYVYSLTSENTCLGPSKVVYRFFNKNTGVHLYTVSESEKQTVMNTLPQYRYEGKKFCVFNVGEEDTSDVYRLFNTNKEAHLYTISQNERDTVLKLSGWKADNGGNPVFSVVASKDYAKWKVKDIFEEKWNEVIVNGSELCNSYKYEKHTIYQLPNLPEEDIFIGDIIFNPEYDNYLELIFYQNNAKDGFRGAYYRLDNYCLKLGLPNSNEQQAGKSPQGTSGRYQTFDKGAIYFASKKFGSYRAYAVFGNIYNKYEKIGDESGKIGTVSKWGFPISDAYFVESQKMYCQDFEGGEICEGERTECGNGIVEKRREQCDDGNTVDGDGCNSTCQSELACKSSPYKLPWPETVSYSVGQDRQNSGNSHSPDDEDGKWFPYYNQWAWDFALDDGDDLVASADGEVVFVTKDISSGGCSSTYKNANKIVLKHNDAYSSLYLHLKPNSVSVDVGDFVKSGQKIGEVGLSGYVCGLHLHYTEVSTSSIEYYSAGFGEGTRSEFNSNSVCNETYKGNPQYYNPRTLSGTEDVDGDGIEDYLLHEYFISDNKTI